MSQVSPVAIRTLMLAIPSWARALPAMDDDAAFQDCGVDSLALLELVSELQQVFGLEIPDDDVERISSIADVARYLNQRTS